MLSKKVKWSLVLMLITMLLCASISTAFASKGDIPEEPMKVGFAVPMSGIATALSADAGVKAEIATEYINKYQGGILGREVEAVIYDSKADAKTTVDLFGKLVEQDNVEAILGCLSSGTGLAVAPKVEKEWKIPTLLLEATTMQMFTNANPAPKYLFRIGPDDIMQSVTHVTAVLKEKPNLKTIAIGAPDYEWGHDVVGRFKDIMKELNPDVEFVYTFYHPFAESGPNFGHYITEIMQKSPDVYVGYSWGTDGVAWHNQSKAMGFYDRVPLVFDVFSGTGKGEMASEGVLAETRAGNAMFPSHKLGYPNSKFAPMILEKVGVLPTYGMGVHMVTGLIYLKEAYEKAYDITGEYPTPEMVASTLEGLSITGPCGITSMINHQSTAPGMAVGKLHKEDGKWLIKDKTFVPDYLKILPEDMTVEEFIGSFSELE